MKATLNNIKALWARFDTDRLPEKALLFHARLLELIDLHGWDAVRDANRDLLKLHVRELQHAIANRPELLKDAGAKSAARACPSAPSTAGQAEQDTAVRLLKRCVSLTTRPRTAAEVARVVKALKSALISGRVGQPPLKEPLQRAVSDQANALSTFLRANYSLEEPDTRRKVPIHPDELGALKSLIKRWSPDTSTALSLAFLRMEGGKPSPVAAARLKARIGRYLDDPKNKQDGHRWSYLRLAFKRLDRHLEEGEALEENTLNGTGAVALRLPPRPIITATGRRAAKRKRPGAGPGRGRK